MKLIVECAQKLQQLGEKVFNEKNRGTYEPIDEPTITTDFIKEHGCPCPEGYIFKDENGNAVAFDGFAAKANELVRLDLNYLNAADPKKMYETVFTVMRRNAAPKPMFENKVISHYKIKM